MAIIIKTKNPKKLLNSIYRSIDQNKIDTWTYDEDKDLTHSPRQWINKAWLTPKIYVGELRFGIISQNNVPLSWRIYSIYHGRFIEMLLNHFHSDVLKVEATVRKCIPDNY